MKKTSHQISQQTRKEINAVIKKYNLRPYLTTKYGLLDRIIRGYLHNEQGNIKIYWSGTFPPEEYSSEYHVVCDVVSKRDLKKENKWERPYRIVTRFDRLNENEKKLCHYTENVVYALEDIGDKCEFRMRGCLEIFPAHTCEDKIFQEGLKAIPTACAHECGIRWHLPFALNEKAKEFGVESELKFVGEYSPLNELLVDLYEELQHHNLKTAQRLNILYAFNIKEMRVLYHGKDFKKSVKNCLEIPFDPKSF